MNSIDAGSPHLKHVWVDRFVVRLTQLRPRMNAVTAAERPAAALPDAADLEPKEVAEIFAAEQPPGEVGAK